MDINIIQNENAHNNTNQQTLKKKTSRKKKNEPLDSKPLIDIDIYKEKVIAELSNINKLPKNTLEKNKRNITTCIEYEKLYRQYMQEHMNNNIIVFLNRIIMDLPQKNFHLRNVFQLHKVLLEIIKSTMMNELEVVYFKIFLDKFGWETDGISFEDNILILCFEVKMLLNEDINIIFQHHIQYNNNLLELINIWRRSKQEYTKLTTSPKELNITFKHLSKPFNPFCKADFVDFNFIVDYILELSYPYSENKNNYNNNNNIQLAHTKTPDKSPEIKKINVQNNIIINEVYGEERSFNNTTFNPKFLINKQIENKVEKITNTIESVNNNNFANLLNQNYQSETATLRNDSDNRIFNKNESENLNLVSRLCSFGNTNDFNQNIQNYSNIQMSSQIEENDDKLEHMFFKSSQNNTFKNSNFLSNTANKNSEESQFSLNLKFSNSPKTCFNKYKKIKKLESLNNIQEDYDNSQEEHKKTNNK